MKKHLIFSAMLGLCALGGTAMYPVSVMAAVAQSPAIKVSGQVVDEQGEPLLGKFPILGYPLLDGRQSAPV